MTKRQRCRIKASLSEARGYVALTENDFHRAIESLHAALNRWTAQGRRETQCFFAVDCLADQVHAGLQ